MKLAHYQIEQIREYIKDQNIWYDDVREEILDHVATAVEERMSAAPLNFVTACAEVFEAVDLQKFQAQKLKAEQIESVKVVCKEMLTFLTGIKLVYLVAIITINFLVFAIFPALREDFLLFFTWAPIMSMIYYIIIPTYARKFRVLYHSFYVCRIYAIYLPAFMATSIVTLCEKWLLSHPSFAITLFAAYHLFVISGVLVMNRTLKQVKTDVAI